MGDTTGSGDLVDVNRMHWDERVPINVGSSFYDVEGFKAGDEALEQFELDEVGDVAGLDLVHLQCHVGLDTLAWARRGARVTGLDFSAPAIDAATRIAAEVGLADRSHFVVADALDAVAALGEHRFDVVYTGDGALMWLPDIDRWARTVASLLRPSGRLYLAEFHPLTDVLDDDRGATAARDYFVRDARSYESPGSYADWTAETTHNTAVEWHHTLGDVISAVAAAGLRVEFVHEHDSIPFQRYGSLVRHGSRFRYPEGAAQLPLMYSLAATAR